MNKAKKKKLTQLARIERNKERAKYGKHGMAQKRDIPIYYDKPESCKMPQGEYSHLRHNQWVAHIRWSNPDNRKCPNTQKAKRIQKAIWNTQ